MIILLVVLIEHWLVIDRQTYRHTATAWTKYHCAVKTKPHKKTTF